MKNVFARALFGGAILLAGSAQAAIVADIDFSEASVGTVDPLIEGLQFSANSGADPFYADTYVDDFYTSGNNYLLSGADDAPDNYTPYDDVGLINVDFSTLGGADTDVTVSLKAALDAVAPGGTMVIRVDALLGSTTQAFTTGDFDTGLTYQTLTVSFSDLAFDSLRIYGTTESVLFPFFIDDLTIDVVNTGGGTPTPSPATVGLMGLGLLGMMRFAKRRRQSA